MAATVYSSLHSLAGTATVEAANCFIAGTCLPDHNRRFAIPPELQDSANVALAGSDQIDDILCRHAKRTVANDNSVRYGKRVLHFPAGLETPHYVKTKVKRPQVSRRHPPVFHGPRCLARYRSGGEPLAIQIRQTARSASMRMAGALWTGRQPLRPLPLPHWASRNNRNSQSMSFKKTDNSTC